MLSTVIKFTLNLEQRLVTIFIVKWSEGFSKKQVLSRFLALCEK